MTSIEDHPGRQQQNWKSLTNWKTYMYSNSKAEPRRKPRWSEPGTLRKTDPRTYRGVHSAEAHQEGPHP